MLERLRDAADKIHNLDPNKASTLYLKAIVFLQQSARAFDGALDEESSEQVRARLYEIAEATQILAYQFYHHHHRPIADGAIDPERFDYGYRPPGQGLPHLKRSELQPYLLEYLSKRLPHTLSSDHL